MSHPVGALIRRDWRLAIRRPAQALLPLVFFVVAASLFPLGVGPEPQMLRTMAPGVVWVCALLAAMMSLGSMYAIDHQDGTLEQYMLCGQSLSGLALGKALIHWVIHGLPLVLVSPLIALAFGMPFADLGVLMLSLLIGTPVTSLLGGLGSALTLGARSAGMLTILLVLPLVIPVLIFGSGAVGAVATGSSPEAHLSLLGALLLLALVASPWGTAAALRIALD